MFGQFVAYLALALFPLMCVVVFQRSDRAMAASLCVLGGSLFLPEVVAFDLPLIPPMDKEYVTYLSVLFVGIAFYREQFKGTRPLLGVESLVFLLAALSVFTMLQNSQPVFDEGKLEDGLGPYWLFAHALDDLLTFALPMFLGRALITSVSDLRRLFLAMALLGFVYCLLSLVEILMSFPFHVWQLSQVVYGVPMRPMWRWGVIQPILFMDNGLAIATYMACASIAATALWRARKQKRIAGRRTMLFSNLFGLFLTRNVAGNLYGFGFSFLVAFFRPSLIRKIALVIALLLLAYPFLRILDLFPYRELVSFASQIEPERARSFEGRFLEEDFVLANLDERLLSGWGNISRIPGAETFGRGETGLDGFWIIFLGSRGLLAVFVFLLMFTVPVVWAWRSMGRAPHAETALLVGALMLMVSMRMGDLLINGWWNCLPMFLAGALAGVSGHGGARGAGD